jgi:hypothetical protein
MDMKIASLAIALTALLAPALTHAQSLRLPKFTACEVDAAAIHVPIGLVRFTAPDPAIAFATTTEAKLSLARRPSLAAYLTRQGPDAPWHLRLMRDIYSPPEFVPPDAELRFHADGQGGRAYPQKTKGDWQVFEIDIAQLLAAYPGLTEVSYAVRTTPSGRGLRARTFATDALDLGRLRSLLAWAEKLDGDVQAGLLPCGAQTTEVPAAVDPKAYVDCRLGEAGGYLGWNIVWDDHVQVAWQYHLAKPPEPNTYINVVLAGPVTQAELAIPDPLGEGPDPMDPYLWAILFPDSHALVTRAGLKNDDQSRLTVRFEGDWGNREISLREVNSRWPADMVSKIMASRVKLNIVVLGPERQQLQAMTLPAGTFAQARAVIRQTLQELSRRVSDPMTFCAPEMSIIV